MPTNHITTEMLLAEQKRIYNIMQRSYPRQVDEHKLTTYERDHRYNCARTIIAILENTIANRPTTEKKILQKQLNHLQ